MQKETHNSSLISKERVRDFGEVYTGSREVEDMLDLVSEQTERIDSRFLEPACGTGNFLVAVLQRKLNTIARRYRSHKNDFEHYAISAISSLYGIDIIFQNVELCRRNLLDCITQNYFRHFGVELTSRYSRSVKFILVRNIVHGDALSMRQVDEQHAPIVFSQWSICWVSYGDSPRL